MRDPAGDFRLFRLGGKNMLVSIVIPCYNSARTIGDVVRLTVEEFEKIPGYDCEFVLVNDYSKDNTFEAVTALCEQYPFVKGISLSKNFGQHNAIMAGLHYTEGEYIIGMDDDLQTHPSQIHKLIEKISEGYDVVFARFAEKKFGFIKKITSKAAGFLTWHMIKRPKGVSASNFWICARFVRDEIVKYTNYNLYLQVLFYRTTGSVANVEVEHFEREEGKSNYTFKKLLTLWLSCLNYTVVPLRISMILGCLFAGGGFIGALVVLIRKIMDPAIPMGWSSVMCAMFVFFGIVLLMLGIIGEYLGKAILNLNNTPQYIVRTELNVKKASQDSADDHEQDGI